MEPGSPRKRAGTEVRVPVRGKSGPHRGGSSSLGLARVFTDTEDHAIVQQRLALVYGLFAVLIAGFYVIGAAATLIAIPERFWVIHLSPAKWVHAFAPFGLGSVWLYLRGRARPRWLLSGFDIVGLLKIATVAALTVVLVPAGLRVELILAAVFVFLATMRAALVPSPPTWTTFVCFVASIPMPIGAYLAGRRDPSWPSDLPAGTPAVLVGAWCLAGTIAAFVISRVVYGLRAEVKSASRLGQYTLEEKIGEGGMGAVYRARHALLRRPTAIKLLAPEKSGAANVRRFEREVQLTSRLTHPNTIAIYDFGHTRGGVFYYAMELLEGVSLHDLCEIDGPQPPGRVANILAQAASALAEAHAVGLIHRDVKPANILLCERGGVCDFVKVLDFGLVKEMASPDPSVSAANAIAGTPLYMAPESIVKPAEVDARVDLYALGAVGYWLLTAEPPFEGANLVEICSHHLHTAPKRPSARLERPIPAALEDLVLKCLAKSPADRPASAAALARALRDIAHDLAWGEDEARAWWEAHANAKANGTEMSLDPRAAAASANPL